MQITSMGIDLGKTTFHLVALGPAGKVLVRRNFSQKQLLTYCCDNAGGLLVRTSQDPATMRIPFAGQFGAWTPKRLCLLCVPLAA